MGLETGSCCTGRSDRSAHIDLEDGTGDAILTSSDSKELSHIVDSAVVEVLPQPLDRTAFLYRLEIVEPVALGNTGKAAGRHEPLEHHNERYHPLESARSEVMHSPWHSCGSCFGRTGLHAEWDEAVSS